MDFSLLVYQATSPGGSVLPGKKDSNEYRHCTNDKRRTAAGFSCEYSTLKLPGELHTKLYIHRTYDK